MANSAESYASFQSSLSRSQQRLLHNSLLRVGIVIESCCSAQESAVIHAIGSPISNCCVTALIIIREETTEREARVWLENCRVTLTPDKVRIMYGQTGYQMVLLNPTLVDAIFVLTPPAIQHFYVMEALRAKKHVLFYDRISQPYIEFNEQLHLATQVGRFLQSSTMFVHHHRVKVFMACVGDYHTFGKIESIKAKLIVNYEEAIRLMGVNFPLEKGDSCVRRLGRFCVLITVLLLSRAGSRPVSAQVTRMECEGETGGENNDDGTRTNTEPLMAHGTVRFTDNRVLTFHVAYSSIPTRQILEVHAPKRYATMTDFVFAHRDGLATYRVYDKDVEPLSGKLEVVKAESLDVMSGPPQDVMMWKDFSFLCDAVERGGYASPDSAAARELANVAYYTKRVLLALEESIIQKQEVPVTVEDLMF
jgi:predicted dehydrogenase